MGCIDGKWAPLIVISVINTINGMVNALIKKVLDGGINHMVVATYRLGISTLFLLPIAYFWERKTRPKLTARVSCQLFVSALFGTSLSQYFYLLGLSYTSATLGSAFWGTLPSITFIMALIFRFEKLNMKTKAGFGVGLGPIISLAGALLLTMYQGIPLSNSQEYSTVLNIHKGHENRIKGCFLLFIGVAFFSSWMLIQAKIHSSYPCPYSGTVILSVFGTLQCALLSLIKTRDVEDWILRDKLTILTLIIAGVFGQGVATVGLSWCIEKRGPVFTSAFSPVTLMVATLFDFLILHRMIYLGSIIGSVVIVIGLYLFLWSKGKQIADSKIVKLPTSTVGEAKQEEDHTNVNKLGRLLVSPMTP
ncbi:WAT1-related protein At4g01450 [Raphanus sativus]|uniref:WAT1-related protein n=1 Tax=Raphanus sativus TaxID=3726 RepID=A0A6J0MN39_RAPSA|nr:WAT1-related protein At4g01450 [Raphanus sativus]